MVAEALTAGPAWPQLDKTTQSVLFAAALLHDVAKPACTRLENGRIVSSPGHARQGAAQAQRLLYQEWPAAETAVPFAIRQQIVGLVRHHGLPLWFLDKPDPLRAAITVSHQARLDQVSQVAKADVLGRYCADQPELLERLALFQLLCEENGCWQRPFPFPSDHSRFHYFRQPGRDPYYPAHDETRNEVMLLAGLPGAGKDTWLAGHGPDWPVISLDALRRQMGVRPEADQGKVVAAAKTMARDYLRRRQRFVWNATNISRALRRSVIDLFAAYGARLVYIEAPWPILAQRNQTRPNPVPSAVLHRLAGRLEIPAATEAHQVEWLVTGEATAAC
jgi:predicted kinase